VKSRGTLEVRAARDRVDGQTQAASGAMQGRDDVTAALRPQDADEKVTVIEQFLAK
jgi:hypothetical protein